MNDYKFRNWPKEEVAKPGEFQVYLLHRGEPWKAETLAWSFDLGKLKEYRKTIDESGLSFIIKLFTQDEIERMKTYQDLIEIN